MNKTHSEKIESVVYEYDIWRAINLLPDNSFFLSAHSLIAYPRHPGYKALEKETREKTQRCSRFQVVRRLQRGGAAEFLLKSAEIRGGEFSSRAPR